MTSPWTFYLLLLLIPCHAAEETLTSITINDEIIKIDRSHLASFYTCLCKTATSKCVISSKKSWYIAGDKTVTNVDRDINGGFPSASYECELRTESFLKTDYKWSIICTKRHQCLADENHQKFYIEDVDDCDSKCVFITGAKDMKMMINGNNNEDFKTCSVTCDHSRTGLITLHPTITTASTYPTESSTYIFSSANSTISDSEHNTEYTQNNTKDNICNGTCNNTGTQSLPSTTSISAVGTDSFNNSNGQEEDKEVSTTIIVAVVVSIVVAIAIIMTTLIAWWVRKQQGKTKREDSTMDHQRVCMDTFYENDEENSHRQGLECNSQEYALGTPDIISDVEKENKTQNGSSPNEPEIGVVVGASLYSAAEETQSVQISSKFHDNVQHFRNPHGTLASSQQPRQEPQDQETDLAKHGGDIDGRKYLKSSENIYPSEYSELHEQIRNFQNPYIGLPHSEQDEDFKSDPNAVLMANPQHSIVDQDEYTLVNDSPDSTSGAVQVYSKLHDKKQHLANPYGPMSSSQQQEQKPQSLKPVTEKRANDNEETEYEYVTPTENFAHTEYSGLHEQARNFHNPYNGITCSKQDENFKPDPLVLQRANPQQSAVYQDEYTLVNESSDSITGATQIYSKLHDKNQQLQNPYGPMSCSQQKGQEPSILKSIIEKHASDDDENEYEYVTPSEKVAHTEYSGLHQQARNFQNIYNEASCSEPGEDHKPDPTSTIQPNVEQVTGVEQNEYTLVNDSDSSVPDIYSKANTNP